MNWLWNMRRVDPLPGPPMWVPILGQLQKTLQQGDYLPLRPLPMLESNFVQVTSQGAPVYVHHRGNHLTMGVAASLPGPVLPDLLLIARPSEGRDCPNLILTRMIPLDKVHLYVYNLSARCLKLRLLTGRCYYLELNAPDKEMAFLFERWIHLINLLGEPTSYWAPQTLNTPDSGLAHVAPPASTWQLQDQPHRRCSAVAAGVRKMLTSQKQKKAKASRPGPDRRALHPDPSPAATPSQPLQSRFRSQAVGDSVPLIWSQLEPPGAGKGAGEKKSRPDPGHGSQTKTSVSGPPVRAPDPSTPVRASITIRTIFSIFSRSFSTPLSSSKGCSADGAAVLGGLAETPSHCLPHSPDTLLVSYKHLYMREALGGLMDPDSSTLSSSSLSPDTYPPSFYPPARRASAPKQDGQARPQRPQQRLQPPPSQRAPSAPAASRKAPAPLKQPQKVPAERKAPSRKAPAAPKKTPVLPSAPKKTPVLPSAPRKAPAPSKTPRVRAIPQEAASHSVPGPELPRTRYLVACDSAALGAGPAGSRVGTVPENKTEPLRLGGTQETKVTEVRAQKMSLELPCPMARREREEVVVGQAREVALDGLKGRGQAEDRLLDLPGFRQRRKRVQMQQLAVGGAPGAARRPFSAEELTLARLMITGKAKEPPLRPRLLGLPSWLLITQVSAMSPRGPEPPSPRQAATVEGAPGAARERPPLGPGVKGGVGLWVEKTLSVQVAAEPEKLPSVQRGPSKVRPRALSDPRSRKLDGVSEAPIPLPAMRWEDVPSQAVSTPISKMEARVSQKLNREAAETKGEPGQGPVAKAGSSLGNLVPKLLALEKMRNMASMMKQAQQAPSPASSVAGSQSPFRRYKVQKDPSWPDSRRHAFYCKNSDTS